MRLFIAIPLADAVEQELEKLIVQLRPSAPQMRFTVHDSWHITLQFLGNATPGQLSCLTARLAEVHCEPFRIQIGELGIFDRAGILFADVVIAPALIKLQEAVLAATSHCGFAAETRPYHPHITLARKAGSKPARKQGSSTPGKPGRELRSLIAKAGEHRFSSLTAHEFLLYESHLSPAGSRYEVRGRFPLIPRAGYTGDDESDG